MSIPIFGGLLPIKPREALRDAFAGLTLASMNVPQVLGYTRIAETPVVTGLYTVLLPLVGFAVFGSSRHLVVAADSATAAIFASSLSRMAAPASEHYMALVGMVALLTAGLLVLARIFKLGFLADFLSRTALIGFLSGVGVQVGIAMLGDMTGVKIASHRTLVQLWQVLQGLPTLHPWTLGLSLFVAASILLGKKFAPRFPVSLVVVVGAIAASARLHLADQGFSVIGPVHGGLPPLSLPDVTWSETLAVLPVALSCFVMVIAQSAATSRVYAIRHQQRVDENADILGLAAANAAAAVSGAFVVNGSPTQTAMADGAGARSQVAQLAFAGIVLIVLLFLTGPLQYLPRCGAGEHRVHDRGRHGRRRGPQEHPSGKPGRIFAGDRQRRGGGGGRRRAGHPVRDRLLAGAACPPQLSGLCDDARSGREPADGSRRPPLPGRRPRRD